MPLTPHEAFPWGPKMRCSSQGSEMVVPGGKHDSAFLTLMFAFIFLFLFYFLLCLLSLMFTFDRIPDKQLVMSSFL